MSFEGLAAALLGPVDLASYVGFCRSIGVTLTRGQTIVARVAYDGEEPRGVEGAAEFFGNIATIPAEARTVVNAVCGGRGGKTYTLGALRLVYGALTRNLRSLAPGQLAYATVVAPNSKLRQEAIDFALGAFRSHPELEPMLRLPKGTAPEARLPEFRIQRKDGRHVMVTAAVATRGGYDLRGRWHTDLLLDEVAFFRDENSAVNDKDIFEAGSVRVLPGGQTILASTPWAEAGLLHKFHTENYGHPKTTIAVHAPTLALNDSELNKTIVARGYAQDPDNAAREFGARFMTGGTVLFFEPACILAAIDEAQDLPRTPLPGETVAAGGDFGFRSDSSALVVVHRSGELVIVGDITELRPQDGMPLKPSETVQSFAATLRAHGASYLMADGHYRETIVEHLSDIAYAPAPNTPADAYMRARVLFREGRVRIPNHPRLIQQLREVEGHPTPGGGMSITHPRWRKGGHGDLVAALVLALYQLGGEEVPQPKPDFGTPAWESAEKEKRRQREIAKRDAPYWRRRVG